MSSIGSMETRRRANMRFCSQTAATPGFSLHRYILRLPFPSSTLVSSFRSLFGRYLWSCKSNFKMVNGVNVSRDLLWLLTSNNNCHMFKRKAIYKRFSTDPLNPKGFQTLRHSGSIQPKAVSIEPVVGGKKGVVLVYRKRRHQASPGKSLARVTLSQNPKRTMRVIKKFTNSQFLPTGLEIRELI